MKTENKISLTVPYTTDPDGHHLSQTPCPFWRMNHHGITDASIYVGTMSCQSCRWYCSKDVAAHTIQCAIPAKLQARYEREHRRALVRKEQMYQSLLLSLRLQAEEEQAQESASPSARDVSRENNPLPATVSRANEMRRAALEVSHTRLNTWAPSHNGERHNKIGSFYLEKVNKSRGYYAQRWVGEITIAYCRYRLRSYSYEKVWAWIQNIREIYRMVFRRFSWQKNQHDLALLVVGHLASVGILPNKTHNHRSVTSHRYALEAYNRAKAVYAATHKKIEEERKEVPHVTA